MTTRFRGITVREGVLIGGAAGWGEWSPFLEYDAAVAEPWLRCAEEAAAGDWPEPVRDAVPVNVTVPACQPEAAHAIVRAAGCRTAKVKVAEPGRPSPTTWRGSRRCATRSGPAAGSGSTPTARGTSTGGRGDPLLDRAAGGLEYVEQPCAARRGPGRRAPARVEVPIAADESIRRAEDPYRVRDLEAADIAVLKVQPLGGVRACLRIAEDIGLPVVVSSALETSVGSPPASRWPPRSPSWTTPAGSPRCSCWPTTWHAALVPVDGCAAGAVSRGRSTSALARLAAPPDRVAWWGSGWRRGAVAAGSAAVTDSTELARAVVARARRGGVREIVLAPGSRNAPLAFAAYDAAAAGRSGCTPGSTSGGRLPRPGADQDRAPRGGDLHVRHGRRQPPPGGARGRPRGRTAGRGHRRPPGRLRGTGANQTTDQVGIFGPLGPGRRTSAPRRGASPGRSASRDRCTSTSSSTSRWCRLTAGSHRLCDRLGARPARRRCGRDTPSGGGRRPDPAGPRTVVVAGDERPPARMLAERSRWPLLAEPTSGSRTGAHAIRTYRLLLGRAARRRRRAGRRLRPPDPVPPGHPAAAA